MNDVVDVSEFSQIVEPKEVSNSQEIFNESCRLHERFDAEVWKKDDPNRESFHNKDHLIAVREAAFTLMNGIEKDDPLDIKGDLKKWNDEHGTSITLLEFKEIVEEFVAIHDSGNIAGAVRIAKGKIEADFLPGYTAKDAEDRSRHHADVILPAMVKDETKLKSHLPLVKHLIWQTRYMVDQADQHQPFATFARVVDQIGNDLHRYGEDENKKVKKLAAVEGLKNEWVWENSDRIESPHFMINFIDTRFPQLVPDDPTNRRQRILQLWKRQMPEVDNTYAKDKVPLKVFSFIKPARLAA